MGSERLQGLVELMGIHEESVSPGTVRCWIDTTTAHQNIQGVIHGSVTMALLDTAMGHALAGLLEETQFCSTTQISFQFLQAARPGERLSAEGTVTRKGRKIAFLEGVCRDLGGGIVARAAGTWYLGTKRT